MQRRFSIFDVFTDHSLAGNQLGVVYDCEGLDTKAMQSIAREFNFPETVFVLPPQQDVHSAKLRIFTPASELPFAGHPTVGAAIAVAKRDGMEALGQGLVVLEEGVGPVRCAVRFDDTGAFAEFDLPVIAKPANTSPADETLANALNLEPGDIGFENHRPSIYDGGLAYQLVPVRDLEAIARAKPNASVWEEVFNERSGWSAYVYCRETVNHEAHFHARMFAPQAGIPEDPATGSAVASLVGAIAEFDAPSDGPHRVVIEQGIEMGRPSRIHLELDLDAGQVTSGRIGGHAVLFAEGALEA